MDLEQIGEYDCESGQWCAYLARLEQYFSTNLIIGEYRLPTLLRAMGQEAYDMLVDLASPRKVSTLKYGEVVAIMRENLQAPSKGQLDENNGRYGIGVNNPNYELAELLEAVQLTAAHPDRPMGSAAQAAGSSGGALGYQASGGSDYTPTDGSIRRRPCTSCGRGDHEKEVCRHRNSMCSYCYLAGHVRRMCPDRDFWEEEDNHWSQQ